ncbi:MAG: NAD-glutamate dehydrogenase [Gammaproteobacteria bacterium]|nr:NAD-glutamate dehydrogenase [Gammaproteobacteria bacterium]
MARISVDNKDVFQSSLERRIAKYDKSEAIRHFARHYFSQIPLAEICTKDWKYVEGSLLSSWEFFKSFGGKQPRCRVFNPSKKKHGYEHGRSVIEVACGHLPFLLQSIRMELTNHHVDLKDVQQCLLNVVRDNDKIVLNQEDQPNETLIRLEVDRLSDPTALQKDIREVIRLVGRANEDFSPMRRQLLLWGDELGSGTGRRTKDQQASYECLQWLYANNFTFLGYEEFTFNGKAGYELVPGSTLGLVRRNCYASNRPLEKPEGLLAFSRSPLKSRVHRPAYFDEITIALSDKKKGKRACRFIGLFTSSVFNQNPAEIPVVQGKIAYIFDQMGLSSESHKGRELARIVEILPREELFQAETEELRSMVERIYSLQERRIVRVIVRQDKSGHFVNCLVYVPRDTYDTALRLKIQDLLSRRFDAASIDFSTFFSESALIRIHFVLKVNEGTQVSFDSDELEQTIAGYTRSWEDDLRSVLITQQGSEQGEVTFDEVKNLFPPGYKHDYWPATAYGDIEFILGLSEQHPLDVCLYQWMVGSQPEVRFKVFHLGDALPLSDVMPILENLGARTREEHPYEMRMNGKRIWIHDFVLDLSFDSLERARELRQNFEDAFLQTWAGDKENDTFNRLVTSANMKARQIWVIRALGHYLSQLQRGTRQGYIADCIRRHSDITRDFFSLFELRFDPDQDRRSADRQSARLEKSILNRIEQVENLDDDRILRSYLELILAAQRTNYYQMDETGKDKEYLSIKFLPKQLSVAPKPKPLFEVFVYSCWMEGVHLRGGKIARGGLRWSDRSEDYRTEVLGLVKAQQVKNSVIVPLGAKGGFLPRRPMGNATRDEVMAEGIRCYRTFISGLLDVTDNLVKGRVVAPDRVVRHDADDSYLVVAADKGTATFSDIANDLAEEYGFWLGDAFASGGSNGYDHKQMGITARGAWKSVQQHFRDIGINDQKDDFSVVGIGDMSGDVFGNGMLQSKHIRLVAAFNHLDIFVDPEPNAERSYKERARIYELPRSTWQDYDRKLISKGGGVYSRSAKSIPVSAEMKKRFDITENKVTPAKLINYLLKARVDLLWNGGIGTYVKGRFESDQDVGDKANDAIRVDGEEVRSRVVGEGGNLGLTQLGRIEFNLSGGVCFTDFIDNAGGVNCSDAEVNIKILLNQLVEQGKLSPKGRNDLCFQMTDAVAEIVLENNVRQAQAINLMQHQSARRNLEYVRVLQALDDAGYLDRELEYLPGDDEIQERVTRNQALTAPELSTLTSHVKGAIKERLAQMPLDDPYLMGEMYTAFPQPLVQKYRHELGRHQLRKEIIATQIANNMINNMGMSFVHRIAETTGASTGDVALAYLCARDSFGMESRLAEIRALDEVVDPLVQKELTMDVIRLVRRATRWFIRYRRESLDLSADVPVFQKALVVLTRKWETIVCGDARTQWQNSRNRLIDSGVPESLAEFVAATHHLYSLLGIVEISSKTGESTRKVGNMLFNVSEQLHLSWFSKQMHDYEARSHWEALARESLQDDLNTQQVAITLGIISEGSGKKGAAVDMVNRWMKKHGDLVQRWLDMQSEIRSAKTGDLSLYTVAIRELTDLSQSSSKRSMIASSEAD